MRRGGNRSCRVGRPPGRGGRHPPLSHPSHPSDSVRITSARRGRSAALAPGCRVCPTSDWRLVSHSWQTGHRVCFSDPPLIAGAAPPTSALAGPRPCPTVHHHRYLWQTRRPPSPPSLPPELKKQTRMTATGTAGSRSSPDRSCGGQRRQLPTAAPTPRYTASTRTEARPTLAPPPRWRSGSRANAAHHPSLLERRQQPRGGIRGEARLPCRPPSARRLSVRRPPAGQAAPARRSPFPLGRMAASYGAIDRSGAAVWAGDAHRQRRRRRRARRRCRLSRQAAPRPPLLPLMPSHAEHDQCSWMRERHRLPNRLAGETRTHLPSRPSSPSTVPLSGGQVQVGPSPHFASPKSWLDAINLYTPRRARVRQGVRWSRDSKGKATAVDGCPVRWDPRTKNLDKEGCPYRLVRCERIWAASVWLRLAGRQWELRPLCHPQTVVIQRVARALAWAPTHRSNGACALGLLATMPRRTLQPSPSLGRPFFRGLSRWAGQQGRHGTEGAWVSPHEECRTEKATSPELTHTPRTVVGGCVRCQRTGRCAGALPILWALRRELPSLWWSLAGWFPATCRCILVWGGLMPVGVRGGRGRGVSAAILTSLRSVQLWLPDAGHPSHLPGLDGRRIAVVMRCRVGAMATRLCACDVRRGRDS